VTDPAGPATPVAPGATPRRGRRRLVTVIVAVVLVALAAGAVALLVGGTGGDGGAQLRYVVPAGTGARLDAGEAVEILPRLLEIDAGDTVVVVNEDDRAHVVGPFSVRAGETTSYTFDEPGRYLGACSVHPDGEITILVR
jgi:plastocyanin